MALNSCQSTERLFRLLGWEFKDAEDQLLPPAATFQPLGVFMDFACPKLLVVGNTEKRKARIRDDINDILRMAEFPQAPLQSLIGVSQFAEAQTCGRTGSLILRDVRDAARVSGPPGHPRLIRALTNLREYFEARKPRAIRLDVSQPSIIILTDAAAETSGASLGAVMVDPASGTYEYFGKRISPALVARWCSAGREQVICQAELVTIPLALETWRNRITGRDVLVFN